MDTLLIVTQTPQGEEIPLKVLYHEHGSVLEAQAQAVGMGMDLAGWVSLLLEASTTIYPDDIEPGREVAPVEQPPGARRVQLSTALHNMGNKIAPVRPDRSYLFVEKRDSVESQAYQQGHQISYPHLRRAVLSIEMLERLAGKEWSLPPHVGVTDAIGLTLALAAMGPEESAAVRVLAAQGKTAQQVAHALLSMEWEELEALAGTLNQKE